MKQCSLQRFRQLPVIAAGLLALFALFRMEGASTAIPIWAALLIVSIMVPARIPGNNKVQWLARVPIMGFAILMNLSHTLDTVNMFDTRTMTWFGELCAAEMVLSCWTRNSPTAGSTRPLWLAGLIMLAASSTQDDAFIALVCAPFFLALLVALRLNSPTGADDPPSRPAVPWRYAIAVALALLGGAGVSNVLMTQRSAITQWGMQFLGEHIPFEQGALSINPKLTSTVGQRGSMTRAMRIDGGGEFSHLRGLAFTAYHGGSWGPRRTDTLQEEPLTTEMEPVGPGRAVHVTRLLNNHGIVFAPLNSVGIHFPDSASIFRMSARGGMIGTHARAPSQYDILLSNTGDFQGPLCRPPTQAERSVLLRIPRSLDLRVVQLASNITQGVQGPKRRLEAIERYLTLHHHYSLRVDIGPGDPVSNFLLQRKSAHCEYFASAAVILARCAGVPARYVIGYLAHERDGGNTTIVRQRDAHAWAECWIEGTGWVVLDATPGDGRPDAREEALSPVTRAMERFQDAINALRLGSRSGGLITVVAVGIGAIVVIVAIRALWLLWKGRRPRAGRYTYAASNADLVALLWEFERSCRAFGVTCPPGTTWSEFLASADRSAMPEAPWNDAVDFIRCYNAARFGQNLASSEMERLRRLLARLKAARASAVPAMLRRI